MIGVDTNVLVRVLVPDAPGQTSKALSFLAERTPEDPVYVSTVVAVELAWVLRRSYAFSPPAIIIALESLLESENAVVERAVLIGDAVERMRNESIDLADYLISAIAREAGAAATLTFDRDAAKRVPGMELLK